jgi:hypothetical protein
LKKEKATNHSHPTPLMLALEARHVVASIHLHNTRRTLCAWLRILCHPCFTQFVDSRLI